MLFAFANVELNETTGTALHYQSDMAAPVSGTFADNTGTAIKHGQFTTSDRTYDGLDLSGNAIGMVANGAGNIMITNSDFDNTMDVKITGGSIVTFVDGTVNENVAVDQIDVSGSGMFERSVLLITPTLPIKDLAQQPLKKPTSFFWMLISV